MSRVRNLPTALDAAASTPGDPSPVRGWLAVGAVTVGIFTLMTSELLPVGLLTPVGSELGVSDGTAGLMVTVPGIVAGVAAPFTAVMAGRLDRRLVLGVLLALLAVANLACALAPTFAVVLVARLLVGVSVGGFWAVAGGLALRLVAGQHVPAATAVIFGGVSTASVLGVPAGTVIGDLTDWRTAFAAVGVLGLVTLGLLVLLVPSLPATGSLTFPDLGRLLRDNPGVRAGALLTLLLVTGHFAAYTFVRPILREISGVAGNAVGLLLLGYGAAGVVGNFVAGAAAGRDVRRTVVVIAAALSTAMALFTLVGGGQVAGSALLVGWGLAYGGVSVALQTWMLSVAPAATEAATSLFVAMFNFSIALGALAGGLAVDGIATTGVLWLGAGLALVAATSAVTSRKAVRGSVGTP